MATSSIYTNIEIKDAEAAERLVFALEKSEELVKSLPPVRVDYRVLESKEEILRFFGMEEAV